MEFEWFMSLNGYMRHNRFKLYKLFLKDEE